MKNSSLTTVQISMIAMTGFCLLFTMLTFAQTPTSAPTEQYFLSRQYMKVEPGKRDDYLKVEKVWKKVHQRRIAEGKIVSWSLYRCLFPSGSNAEYDYMTVTTFKSGKEIQDSNNMTWDYIKQGMSAEDLAIADNTGKTRKIVSSSLYQNMERVQPQPNTNFTQVTTLKANAGQGGELAKHEKMMKPVFEEAAKMGAISGWRFGRIVYPITEESGNYYRITGATTLDQMLKTVGSNYIETAFKKVYPAKNYEATMKTIRDLMTVKDVELWEKVDGAN